MKGQTVYHSNRERILIIDDDPRYVRLIRLNLEGSGYSVLTGSNGVEAIEIAARHNPALILLDIDMPGKDGFAACREIRQFSDVPIIMLTALDQVEFIIRGLDAGADDYVTKPLDINELLARIRARLRRSDVPNSEMQPVLRFEGLKLELDRGRVFVRDTEVHLTPTEYRLLVAFATRAGKILVPDQLLRAGWNSAEHEPNLLWQAIHRLRQKIEVDPSNPQYIQTRAGIGYVFIASRLPGDEEEHSYE